MANARKVRCTVAIAALSAALLLQGCGGGSSPSTSNVAPAQGADPSSPASTNRAPTISGTPVVQVQAGNSYQFTPTASDADGNALTFSITNKPSWAAFSTSTGALTGTAPASGTFANVIISVSDGTASAALAAFSIAVAAAPVTTATVTVSWTPPTTRSDGSTLTNLAGYYIRYGTAAGTYPNIIQVDNPGLTSYAVENLKSGVYYFAVTAFDASGLESVLSNAASKTIN